MASHIPSICYYLSFPKYWPIYFDIKMLYMKEKIDRQGLNCSRDLHGP